MKKWELAELYTTAIKDHRLWLRWALIFFCSGLFFGVLAGFADPEQLKTIADYFSEKIGSPSQPQQDLMFKIFFNNVQITGVMMFLGIAFGMIPGLFLFANGLVIGYVIIASYPLFHIPLWQYVIITATALIPHGIPELAAFICAGTLGLRFGTEWLFGNYAGVRLATIKRHFLFMCRAFPFISILLFLSALIETYGTRTLLDGVRSMFGLTS